MFHWGMELHINLITSQILSGYVLSRDMEKKAHGLANLIARLEGRLQVKLCLVTRITPNNSEKE